MKETIIHFICIDLNPDTTKLHVSNIFIPNDILKKMVRMPEGPQALQHTLLNFHLCICYSDLP